MIRRVLRVAGDELVVIPSAIEIEGIAGIHVDELQIRLRHREFAKPDRAAAEPDVIAVTSGSRAASEDLHEPVPAYHCLRKLSSRRGRRKHASDVEEQVIVTERDSAI